MRVQNRSRPMALMMWLIATTMSGAAVPAEVSQSSDTAQIQELQRQVDALTKELATVSRGSDLQAQRSAMQSHWSMMQKHMGSVRQRPGMGPTGCSDWTMMDRSMMGGGMMGRGMMGHRTKGGCWDHGMGMMRPGMSGWALPNEAPEQYQKRMRSLQQDMRKQMAAIAAETDPAKRDALIRQHYDTMYRNMQTMRGMGWMWNGDSASALPDEGSPGATLESKYCSQCHAAPPPDVHTAKEWADVIGRMEQHIGDVSKSTGDVRVPSASELTTIVEYLDQHAKPGS